MTDPTTPPPRARRGDTRPDGLIFWARLAGGKEDWLTPDAYAKRRRRVAAYAPPGGKKYARNVVTLSVVWSPELLTRVDEIAEKAGKSRSKVINEAVRIGLDKITC